MDTENEEYLQKIRTIKISDQKFEEQDIGKLSIFLQYIYLLQMEK